MGVYDMLPGGSQVKCWECEMKHYGIGDSVPEIHGYRSYVVILQQGGAVIVEDCQITWLLETTWDDDGNLLQKIPLFDKWAGQLDINRPLV